MEQSSSFHDKTITLLHQLWLSSLHRNRDQVPSATEWVNRLLKARQEVEAALALAKAAMKQQFDKHCSESQDYKPGDLVWLEGTNIKTQ